MFKATEAKNRFGAIMKLVDDAKPVFIEKHGTAHAVVLDIDSYTALVESARRPEEAKLEALRSEFEALYASMQTGKSWRGVDALLSAPAGELNKGGRARSRSRG
jgi:prevent-host-death family protein